MVEMCIVACLSWLKWLGLGLHEVLQRLDDCPSVGDPFQLRWHGQTALTEGVVQPIVVEFAERDEVSGALAGALLASIAEVVNMVRRINNATDPTLGVGGEVVRSQLPPSVGGVAALATAHISTPYLARCSSRVGGACR
jgi:hypothetical protein